MRIAANVACFSNTSYWALKQEPYRAVQTCLHVVLMQSVRGLARNVYNANAAAVSTAAAAVHAGHVQPGLDTARELACVDHPKGLHVDVGGGLTMLRLRNPVRWLVIVCSSCLPGACCSQTGGHKPRKQRVCTRDCCSHDETVKKAGGSVKVCHIQWLHS
jgi:hypothetical protein